MGLTCKPISSGAAGWATGPGCGEPADQDEVLGVAMVTSAGSCRSRQSGSRAGRLGRQAGRQTNLGRSGRGGGGGGVGKGLAIVCGRWCVVVCVGGGGGGGGGSGNNGECRREKEDEADWAVGGRSAGLGGLGLELTGTEELGWRCTGGRGGPVGGGCGGGGAAFAAAAAAGVGRAELGGWSHGSGTRPGSSRL